MKTRTLPCARFVGCVGAIRCLALAVLLGGAAATHAADMPDEFNIKREAVFAFAQKPIVTREGDTVTVSFETTGLCDVTVAIEGPNGRIVRHRVSGVLGPKAPEPLQKNSKKQTVVWDGKDDRDVSVDDKDACTVRVSLGLKPQFDRSLLWHPKKRSGWGIMPFLAPQPEGVYVYDAFAVEQIRLYDRQGNYVRTVYPFATAKLKDIKGLEWRTLPDGYRAPKKAGYWGCTFLTGGRAETHTGPGDTAQSFAVRAGKIAVLGDRLGRLATDGTTGAMDLCGPTVTVNIPADSTDATRPLSAALDSWAEPARIRLCTMPQLDDGQSPPSFGVRIFTLANGKLEEEQSWQKEVIASIGRWKFPPLARQRLYVDPTDGSLLVGEGDVGSAKAFTRLFRVDPATGTGREMELPLSAEELAIDRDGLYDLRTTPRIARFDPSAWREVPFDYGEPGEARFPYGKPAMLASGLPLPSTLPGCWHQHGMDVNVRGDLAVFCVNAKQAKRRDEEKNVTDQAGAKPYTPPVYPGRLCHGELHVFDKHGKIKVEDAVQGLPMGHGVCMDRAGNLYVHLHGSQIVDGKTLFHEPVGTIAKFKPKAGKITIASKDLPRPLGGDEVALMYANFVVTDTDRRLFIADPGNLRILSVRLDDHANETIRLKDVKDDGKK